jgi:hypothetical protein
MCNGVAVRGARLFDATDVFQDYERALVVGNRDHVTPDDEVLVVGGSRGVSSVFAALEAAPGGPVISYEGSEDRHSVAREMVALNVVDDRVTVEHAIVGGEIDLADLPGDAKIVSPTDLPDCEGAEIGILERLDQRPGVVIVETHAFLDSPEPKVRAVYEDREYGFVEVEETGVHVPTAVEMT